MKDKNYDNYTAADARRIALSVNTEKKKEQLESILELINDHSNQGELVFRLYDEVLRQDVKEELQKRGFNIIETSGGINETDTIIKY